MPLPFVSRAAFDILREHRDALQRALEHERQRADKQIATNQGLVQQIVELRREGFRPPAKLDAPPPATPTNADDVVHDRARKEFIDNMARDLVAAGATPIEARAEAEQHANGLYADFSE